MNVVNVGVVPAPLPAPLPVQPPASAQASPDAGARNAQEHSRPPKEVEPQPARTPPLKPVSADEFRVMLGALPVSVLSPGSRDFGRAVDLYA